LPRDAGSRGWELADAGRLPQTGGTGSRADDKPATRADRFRRRCASPRPKFLAGTLASGTHGGYVQSCQGIPPHRI